MEINNEEKIKKFHYEEILLILYICSTDLSEYDDDDLVIFTEDIEGRVEVLFEPDFLRELAPFLYVNDQILSDFKQLRDILVGLYESQWHRKLRESELNNNLRAIAEKILNTLNVDYVEPNTFKDNN